MTDFSLYKVDLDTVRPNPNDNTKNLRGDAPRTAFTKYNDMLTVLAGSTINPSGDEPANPVPYMRWYNTSTNPPVEYVRNAANTAWTVLTYPSSDSVKKTGDVMTGDLQVKGAVTVNQDADDFLATALIPIFGRPVANEPREVLRLAVKGVPEVSYGGAFRFFTSSNGYYYNSYTLHLRSHDSNSGMSPTDILSIRGDGEITSKVFIATSGSVVSRPRTMIGFPNGTEPSLSMSRWSGSGSNDLTWRFINDNGTLRFQYSSVDALTSQNQETNFRSLFNLLPSNNTSEGGDLYTDINWRGRYVIPNADNIYDVGLPAQCYRTIYCRTGAINTSDARLKTELRPLTDVEVVVARKIAKVIGIFKWKDSVELKNNDAREHVGPTVQSVIEIMQEHGLDPFNYGFICYDEWDDHTIEHPATEAVEATLNPETREVTEAIPAKQAWSELIYSAGNRYAFRYDELSMFIHAGNSKYLEMLEDRLIALELG